MNRVGVPALAGLNRLCQFVNRLKPGLQHKCLAIAMVLVDINICAAEPEKPTTPNAASAIDARAERIIEQMKSVQEKLSQRDAGTKTQDIQRAILADLDELLKAPPQKSPNQNSSGSSGGQSGGSGGQSGSKLQQQSNSREQSSSSAAANDPSQTRPTGAQRNRQNAEDSTERTGQARAAEIAAARRRRLEVDIWGHLPEHLREQLLNTYGEKMVPQYEDLVKKFYEALSEPPEQGTPKR